MEVSAVTVADSLRSDATRVAILDVLEALDAPIPSAVALAAAPALVDAMVTENDRASFDRCGLLLGRLWAEALPDTTMHAAIVFGERFEAICAPALIAEAVQRASSPGGQPLALEDARSYACLLARDCAVYTGGATASWEAGGRTAMEVVGIVSLVAQPQPPRILAASHSRWHPLSPVCSLWAWSR